MAFPEQIGQLLEIVPASFAALMRHVRQEWIHRALGCLKGAATIRRRKLPADRALWLVIGMALFRERSIEEVVSHLDLVVPGGPNDEGVAPSAIPQARQRLGVEPVQRLFELTAGAWAFADERCWRDLTLCATDGTCLRVPDTVENEQEFGRPRSGRAASAYPQVRITALLSITSRVLAGLSLSAYTESELATAEALWPLIPHNSLTILDRGYLSFWLFHRFQQTAQSANKHFLVRLKSNVTYTKIKNLGPGDMLVEFRPSTALRRKHPEMPETLPARLVTFQARGYRPTTVITSLLDSDKYPAAEIGGLYHERWEIELGYDEIKTHMLGREEALRSKKPEGIKQEIYGIGIAYNLVRVEMARVAEQQRLPPNRISFTHALRFIRNFCVSAWAASPGVLPRRLMGLERDVALLVLPERRSERRYRRQVKIKMSNFPRNYGRQGPPKPHRKPASSLN